MKTTKVVLFTKNNPYGNMVYSFLEKKYTMQGVVIDCAIPGSGKRLIKRRIKKLGFFKVVLQAIFQKGLVPLLRMESKSRVNELRSKIDLAAIDGCDAVFYPKSVNDTDVISHTNALAPDVIVVCGTGIIHKKIIQGLKAPLINIHVGITPKYRGVHGGYWALANKDVENFGVTVHLIDPGIDTGGIISQRTFEPAKTDNYCTYPLFQTFEGLTCIEDAITQIETHTVQIKKGGTESKLYYHPTITGYLYNRLFKGVK